jgi:hypothetical protein
VLLKPLSDLGEVYALVGVRTGICMLTRYLICSILPDSPQGKLSYPHLTWIKYRCGYWINTYFTSVRELIRGKWVNCVWRMTCSSL